MPLGASRVMGARPAHESFRYELWKDLTEDGWTFDFIGTQSDYSDYPAFYGEDFDIDHEGRGGWRSSQILEGLPEWLPFIGSPDIVLFSSPAGNDGLSGRDYDEAISNINAIIDILQDNNPEVTIIIEQAAPPRSDFMTVELGEKLNRLHQDLLSIAEEQTTETSQVIPIDMFTGFTDDYLADDVHYNEAGAEFIAERYFELLVDILEE